MSEFLIQGETLTAIADEVRTLSGVSDDLSPAAMTSNLAVANVEVNTQADLIEELEATLNGKSIPSPLCSFTFTDGSYSCERFIVTYMTLDDDNNPVCVTQSVDSNGGTTTFNCLRNSIVFARLYAAESSCILYQENCTLLDCSETVSNDTGWALVKVHDADEGLIYFLNGSGAV